MNHKIVTFDEVYTHAKMPIDFYSRAASMGDDEIKQEIRNSLYWPEGFLERLRGLSLEEQMEHYRISETYCYSKSSYGVVDSEREIEKSIPLSEYKDLDSLIVEDEIIIGVCIRIYGSNGSWDVPAFPYQNICTYYACDDDGSGGNERMDYVHLFCVEKQ